MSPLDLLRRALPSAAPGERRLSSPQEQQSGVQSLARAAARGAATAALSLVPMLLFASLLWVTTPDGGLGWSTSILTAMSFWLLGHGVPVMFGSAVIGVVPLGALLGVLLLGAWSAGRVTWGAAEHGYRPALRVAGAWAGGYAVVLAVVGLVALTGSTQPHVMRWIAATVLVPGVMALIGMVRALDHDHVDEFLEALHVPAALRRGWRPALHTTALLLGAGTLMALVAVAWSFQDVVALQRDLRPGLAGGVALAVLQVLALPNIGLWGLSFVAGPGFSVVDGAAVTWDGSSTALVPMIPVLAAHPQPALFPALTPVVALALVAVGAWLGWQSLAATARLASLRAKGLTVVSAAGTTGAFVAALDWVGGGALGMDRLSDVGAPAGLLGLAVAGWLLVGAALVLLWDWRSLHR